MKTIIIGGSVKFRDQIRVLKGKLEALSFRVLFPNLDSSIENRDIAESAEHKLQFAQEHYAAIKKADAVYFLLPGGYMGSSCKLELGYALALAKPIFFSEPTGELDLDCYPKAIISTESLQELKKHL